MPFYTTPNGREHGLGLQILANQHTIAKYVPGCALESVSAPGRVHALLTLVLANQEALAAAVGATLPHTAGNTFEAELAAQLLENQAAILLALDHRAILPAPKRGPRTHSTLVSVLANQAAPCDSNGREWASRAGDAARGRALSAMHSFVAAPYRLVCKRICCARAAHALGDRSIEVPIVSPS